MIEKNYLIIYNPIIHHPGNMEEIISKINSFYPLPSSAPEQLKEYVSLLEKWNQKINLIGKSTVPEIWQRHILDSAQLLRFIKDGSGAVTTRVITDFGSGAGLPGMVLAIAGIKDIHLVESSAKKCAFLNEVARITGAKITIHNARIEEVSPWKSDVIIARAFADIDKILEYSLPFLKKESLCFLLKGCKADEELKKASSNWNFRHELNPSLVGDGFIVKLSCIDGKKRKL